MWLCILHSRQFEGTFKNTHSRKVEKAFKTQSRSRLRQLKQLPTWCPTTSTQPLSGSYLILNTTWSWSCQVHIWTQPDAEKCWCHGWWFWCSTLLLLMMIMVVNCNINVRCRVVQGGVPETTELLKWALNQIRKQIYQPNPFTHLTPNVTHRERFDYIFYTGSTNVGKIIG